MDDEFANLAHIDAIMKAALAHSTSFSELANQIAKRKWELAQANSNSLEFQSARFIDCLQRRFRFILQPFPLSKTPGEMWKAATIHVWRQIDGIHHIQIVVEDGVFTKLRFAFPASIVCATYTEEVLAIIFAFLDKKNYLTYAVDIPSKPITMDFTFSTPRSDFIRLSDQGSSS